MSAPDLVVTSRRVVTPDGVRPAAVVVADGAVVAVVAPADAPDAARRDDVGDLVVLPGLVDSHVHVNEPGRTDWEGFATATRAAAVGGVTTIVDMPLNCVPPTTTVAALRAKRAAAAAQAHVDVAFWGGAVPGGEGEMAALHAEGVTGFKAFLCDSGVEEFPAFTPAAVDELVARTAALGATLVVHAEDPEVIASATAAVTTLGSDPRLHTTWLAGRPAAAEEQAVAALVAAARRHRARVHVLHVSAAGAAALVGAARAEGLAVSGETCPHYLVLAAEDVPDGATECKCAPPIRECDNREKLWGALAVGDLGAVVSDHSPCPPDAKCRDSGDFLAAWGGIASLQVGLPLVWTAARDRGHDLDDLAQWMAAAPARLAGLGGKGAIRPGADADLVVFDPDAVWTIDAAALQHRHRVCAYDERLVSGLVRTTYLGGRVVARDGEPVGEPQGRLLRRDPA